MTLNRPVLHTRDTGAGGHRGESQAAWRHAHPAPQDRGLPIRRMSSRSASAAESLHHLHGEVGLWSQSAFQTKAPAPLPIAESSGQRGH